MPKKKISPQDKLTISPTEATATAERPQKSKNPRRAKPPKPYCAGEDAKKRSQIAPDIFKVFKKTLKHMQVDPENPVDMVWLIRAGYTKSFPRKGVVESKIRNKRISTAAHGKRNRGKELGNYTKASNQPLVLGALPIDPRLGKVDEHGNLSGFYKLDPNNSVVLAQSLEDIISQIELGIYELVEGKDPRYLVFKVNPYYEDGNIIRKVNVPIGPEHAHLYRLDLRTVYEIDQLKNKKKRKRSASQLKSILPNNSIAKLEELKEYAKKTITLRNKDKALEKCNYAVQVKFHGEQVYQDLLIAADEEGNPIISDIDGFSLLLPDKYWELLAEKYREFHPKESEFSAQKAKKIFNGVIRTSELERSLKTKTVNPRYIKEFEDQTVSIDQATKAFHFLIHVFHPAYKNKPYSERITFEEQDELIRLMSLSSRGVIRPIILLMLSLLNYETSNEFTYLDHLGEHGFEGDNTEKPQPIEGIVSVALHSASKKFRVNLTNGPVNLAEMLKNIHLDNPLTMQLNPTRPDDWQELKKSLAGSSITTEYEPALDTFCKATLNTAASASVKARSSCYVSSQHVDKNGELSQSDTVPRNWKQMSRSSSEEESRPSTSSASSDEASRQKIPAKGNIQMLTPPSTSSASSDEADKYDPEMPALVKLEQRRTAIHSDFSPGMAEGSVHTESVNSTRNCFLWKLWREIRPNRTAKQELSHSPIPSPEMGPNRTAKQELSQPVISSSEMGTPV